MKYMTLDAFLSREAPALLANTERAGHAGLRAAAEIVKHEVVRELGKYQDAAGPFVAWAELAEATKEDRIRQGYTPNDPGLRSGDMRDSVGVRAEGNHAQVGSDDPKLLWFEMGTARQPPRHVLGGSAFRMKDRIVEAVGSHVAWALRGLPPRNDPDSGATSGL